MASGARTWSIFKWLTPFRRPPAEQRLFGISFLGAPEADIKLMGVIFVRPHGPRWASGPFWGLFWVSWGSLVASWVLGLSSGRLGALFGGLGRLFCCVDMVSFDPRELHHADFFI